MIPVALRVGDSLVQMLTFNVLLLNLEWTLLSVFFPPPPSWDDMWQGIAWILKMQMQFILEKKKNTGFIDMWRP